MKAKAILCEDVEDATYRRLTLYAANVSESVYCSGFPYGLKTTIVVMIDLEPGEKADKLKLRLFVNKRLISSTMADGPGTCFKNLNISIIWPHSEITLPSSGVMKLEIDVDTVTVAQLWDIELGEAASRAHPGKLPPSLVIDGRSLSDSPLQHIIAETCEELLIADQYVTPDFIVELLTNAAPHLRLKVITNEKTNGRGGAITRVEAIGLMSRFPKLAVRFDKLFHDRLVVRDMEEIFVFGASLKDVLHHRVSFFQRIFSESQTQRTLMLVQESWARAHDIC